MKDSLVSFIFVVLICATPVCLAKTDARGVDFRMQINSGNLDFLDISGLQRNMSGFGSQVSAHIYLRDSGLVRSTAFFATRIMSYTANNTDPGETDDLQILAIAPGLELTLGPLYIQAAYQSVNVKNYWISSTSKNVSFAFNAPTLAAGLNFRFGHLGLGIGATQINASVPRNKLGGSTDSQWGETIYSINLIYYIGRPFQRFVPELFK